MSLEPGVYWIRNLHWKTKVLDLDQNTTDQGNKVLDYEQHDTFNKKLNQLWLVENFQNSHNYIIRNVHSNQVLDLSGASWANGTSIICGKQHSGANQQWRIEWSKDDSGIAYYHIINVAAGTTVSHNPEDSNEFIVGWKVDEGSKQLWCFVPYISSLIYRLRVKSTGRVLELSDSSSANGTPLLATDQHTTTKKRNQLWRLQDAASSEGYTIQCLETGTVADLSGGNGENGTAIGGWQVHGGRTQQWKMEASADGYQKITNVAGGSVMDAIKNDDGKRVGGWQPDGGDNQQWLLDAVPSPGPGWVLIQSGHTGRFLCSDHLGNVRTAEGPETVFDESVQWRFLQKDRTGVYTLVNRATGRNLRQVSSQPSTNLVETTEDLVQDQWVLEAYQKSDAGLINIVSAETGNTLGVYGGEGIEALDSMADYPNRSWKIISANDPLTSFALINGETGLCLSASIRREEYHLATENDLDDFESQWIFRKIAEGPLYSIKNKKNNYIIGGSSARWELVVCNDKYFGLRDSSTGKYLAIENGEPTIQAADMKDRHQCWELASGRTQDKNYDMIFMDDDILEALVPFLAGEEGEKVKHHIVKRGGGKKPPKDKSEWKLPSNDRVSTPDNEAVRQLLEALIERWEWDIVNEERQPIQTLISFNRAEAEAELRARGSTLRPAIRRLFDNSSRGNTLFRLDRQGYINIQGGRYVNLQGQFGTNTYFHITLPVGVRYGREQIRRFLRESLRSSTSVVITPSTCKPPSGGPPFKRDPGSDGTGNSWVKWALTIVLIGAGSIAVL